MTPSSLCAELLRLGRAQDFAAISRLPGAGIHAHVARLADLGRNAVSDFFHSLLLEDRPPFLMALAVYEDSVNGLGSVTLLRDLLPEVDDPDHALFDWILRNTRSYWYFSHSAHSYADYVRESNYRAEKAAANVHRDLIRQGQDRARISHLSTLKLYNAVCRGDLGAVKALLKRGADPHKTAPDGEPLIALALRVNRPDIVAALQDGAQAENAP